MKNRKINNEIKNVKDKEINKKDLHKEKLYLIIYLVALLVSTVLIIILSRQKIIESKNTKLYIMPLVISYVYLLHPLLKAQKNKTDKNRKYVDSMIFSYFLSIIVTTEFLIKDIIVKYTNNEILNFYITQIFTIIASFIISLLLIKLVELIKNKKSKGGKKWKIKLLII